MTIDKKTVRLLLLEDSQNEAERLVSLFRNAGRATRVQRLTGAEELPVVLQQTWDLLICAPESRALSPEDVILAIRRQARDIPIIRLVPSGLSLRDTCDAIVEAMSLGAQDALPQGEDEHLMQVAARELANLEERRARRAAELALHEAEKRCHLLLDSSVDAIAYVHDGMHIYANRAYLELFGYADADELEGMPMIDLIAAADQAAFREFLKQYQNGQGRRELDGCGVRVDGETFRARMLFSPASYDGEPCIQVVIRREADNAELEEKLREASTLDPLTGLINRPHFLELIDGAVERAVNAGQPATIAYLQLNHYAQLLADLGVTSIDQLLRSLAHWLAEQLPTETRLARFGDDVFTLLLSGQTPEQCQPLLQNLIRRLEGQLFEAQGRSVQVGLAIGAAGLGEQTARAQDVLDRAHRCADRLEGASGLKVYDPSEELAAEASRGNLLAMLRQALETDGLRLLFQPIISLRGDPHEHYEALLRLISPQGEELRPEDFLDVARQAGLGTAIDRWVIQSAARQLAAHLSAGHRTRLFVHLSDASLRDAGFLRWLAEVLEATRLPADSLVLQLREADAVSYLRQVKALADGLHALRCRVALVQFGCAPNPLGTLRHLDADYVKLDLSFTRDLGQAEQLEQVRTLLAELNALKRLTIVPAVESAASLSSLWQAGVHLIQGHYLQAPTPVMNYDFAAGEE